MTYSCGVIIPCWALCMDALYILLRLWQPMLGHFPPHTSGCDDIHRPPHPTLWLQHSVLDHSPTQTSSSICLDFDILHLLDHPPSVNIPLHLLGIQHHRLSHSPAETASSCCFGVATLLALTFSVDTYISQPTWCLFDWTAKERDGKEVEENIVCFVFNVFLNLQFNDFW